MILFLHFGSSRKAKEKSKSISKRIVWIICQVADKRKNRTSNMYENDDTKYHICMLMLCFLVSERVCVKFACFTITSNRIMELKRKRSEKAWFFLSLVLLFMMMIIPHPHSIESEFKGSKKVHRLTAWMKIRIFSVLLYWTEGAIWVVYSK